MTDLEDGWGWLDIIGEYMQNPANAPRVFLFHCTQGRICSVTHAEDGRRTKCETPREYRFALCHQVNCQDLLMPEDEKNLKSAVERGGNEY